MTWPRRYVLLDDGYAHTLTMFETMDRPCGVACGRREVAIEIAELPTRLTSSGATPCRACLLDEEFDPEILAS